MRTHIPFRKLCPYCVGGMCVSGAHRRDQKTEEEIEKEVLVISADYVCPKQRDNKSEHINPLPTSGGIDRQSESVFAHMVPSKGLDAHVMKMMNR